MPALVMLLAVVSLMTPLRVSWPASVEAVDSVRPARPVPRQTSCYRDGFERTVFSLLPAVDDVRFSAPR